MSKNVHALLFLFIVACLPVQANHLSSSLLFSARLSGDQEVPAVITDAQGVASFSLDQYHTTVYVSAAFSHLSGSITGAHIHEGAPGENGGVVIDLTPFLIGNRLKGAIRNIDKTTITKMLSGNYYINIHTELNPGGEIRGQISLETDTRYTAIMDGDSEVPEVATPARGVGLFHLSHDRSMVQFEILFHDLTGPVTGAHIHNAPLGENGGVVFDLGPFLNGNTIKGIWEPGDLLDALEAGELYVNVHTAAHPGGEIRGQLQLRPGLAFDARLSGEQEVPAVATPADGIGFITVSTTLDGVEIYIVLDSLSGPIEAAHFHMAPSGVNGGVVLDLSDMIGGNRISGNALLSLDQINAMLRGGFYVNVHTAAHPGGEIRGQVLKYAREAFTFDINGGQEVPPVTTPGNGAGLVSIDRDQTNAHFMIVYSGLDGNFTASHFHQGRPGENGDVIYDLTGDFNAFGGAYGHWSATDDPPFTASSLFLNNEVYINIHTDAHPGGEIRGNIIRSRSVFTDIPVDPGFSDHLLLTAALSGDDEVPPVTTTAVGIATLYFDGDKQTGHINVAATGLSGPITGVHIHEGDFGGNGPVLFPLTNVGNRVQESIMNLTDLELTSIFNGATYVNIHTAANPAGEIRGQLALEQDLTWGSSLSGDQESPAVVTDAQGLASIHYTLGQLNLEVNVQLTALSSAITGAHFHAGQPGENGPVIIDLTDLIEGNRIRGNVDITIDDLLNLAGGNVYLNVHTANNPGGEIRGQLNYLPGITFDGWMSPLQEVPFATSEASGLAVGTIFPGPSDIAIWMLCDNTSGPIGAAHLHNAPLLSNGGVVHDLTGSLTGNSLIHIDVLDDGILGDLLRGEIYINAHTAAFPGGELRGQLFRLARDGSGFDLCPEQEVGVVVAPNATGASFVSVDRNHSNLNIGVVVDGLTGGITASHIHGAAIGANGGVIADLTDFYVGNAMFLYGGTADTSIINRVRSGDTYINVHTAIHPAGEVRGQIVKEFLCELMVGVDPLAEVLADVKLSPVPVTDQLRVSMDVLEAGRYEIAIVDITGRRLSFGQYDLFVGSNQVLLPTDNLTPGVYALTISNGSAGQAFKFVK